ncbi:thiamine-phosphate diphosphorylase [Silvanigrella aquatica]|uniref:Thiamine-phosphate synthase n=2 Tax=Silvanigrella aquatica TaxID=1915309 RepID=A0A1L4D4L0_9BACT|nr:thiamine-phosphate diphosphorylase [Silvanigrella aquatica]
MRFYPIVDSFEWVEKLVSWGVKTIQLRIKLEKNKSHFKNIENEIKCSIDYCKKFNCQLFINDYWEIAIQYDAFGIHLGYEDSQKADIEKIFKSNLKLGLSTHDEVELKHALQLNVSYIALGPIFPTQTKIMRFAPQGISKILIWKEKIPSSLPLVAIGGISLEHSPSLYEAGADSVAVISDFKFSENPHARIASWLKMIN